MLREIEISCCNAMQGLCHLVHRSSAITPIDRLRSLARRQNILESTGTTPADVADKKIPSRQEIVTIVRSTRASARAA